MNLLLSIDGRRVDLDFDHDGDACRFRFRSREGAGWERNALLQQVEPCIYSVLLDGRSYEVRLEPGQASTIVAVQGRRFEVDVQDPRRSSRRSAAALWHGRQSISAPMPGKIVRVLVAEGDEVEAGQGLAVVEAMKMQNEMKSPKKGRITSLSAREGAAVVAGEVLAVIE